MNNKQMFLRMLSSYLIKKRSRVIIAILAVGIGATILFGLLTIYYDIPRQLGKEFRSYGANLVILPASDGDISLDKFQNIKKIIGEDKIVGMAPYKYWTCKINEQPYMLAGTYMEEAKANSPFWYIEGRWLKNGEKNKAMLGKEIAEKLDLRIGDSFVVKGVKKGKLAKASSQFESAKENKEKEFGDENFSQKLIVEAIVSTGGAEEGFIFIDINELSSMVEDEVSSDIIECSIELNREKLNLLSTKINENDKSLMSREIRRVTQSQDQVLSKLEALVYLVTLVILLITMVSVSTTMMAMVAERRKEIALKKALGAENNKIIKEFMGESISLGILGGLVGIFLGYLFAKSVSLSVFGRTVNFHLWLVPLAIIISVSITVIASVVPVRKVLEIEPALVLKGE